ncbi:MAG: hypothetical protein CMH62_00440 [Nanoarchaeota archaeon]|nr:hypothetical protein [Nanoarchaeota archaeon]|tara:strand:+ start:488 stop:865 length:378 start_codon:yes stop_codon:yes gene_type:complete
MPHQCVRCAKVYNDASEELLKGCSCGGRFFFYIKKESLKDAEEEIKKLTVKEKEKIQQDVFDIVGSKNDDRPVILDLESIKVLKPGKFEIDVVNLMKGKPVIFRMESGKYVIDLAGTFQQLMKRK